MERAVEGLKIYGDLGIQGVRGTVLCIAVKVAVFYQQVMKLTQNYNFYDFPIPVYARKCILIKTLGDFGYSDTHFTWQNPMNLP